MTLPIFTHGNLDWKWENDYWTAPAWPRKLSLDDTRRVCEKALSTGSKVEGFIILDDGACSKLFELKISNVYSGDYKYLLRVSLPVQPRVKTRVEVTTLRWLQRATNIPVPLVLAFDDVGQNEDFPYEWILTQKVSGVSAQSKWNSLSMAAKEHIVEQVASFQCQLLRHQFPGIGSLYPCNDEPDNDCKNDEKPEPQRTEPVPGPLSTHPFNAHTHTRYDGHRGPFRTSRDWLAAILAAACRQQQDALKMEEREHERNKLTSLLHVGERLANLLPKFFAEESKAFIEPTALDRYYFSLPNMLLENNDSGTIVSVVNWEFAQTTPFWLQVTPDFLRFVEVNERPPSEGIDYDSADFDFSSDYGSERGSSSGEQMDWDKMHLRPLYHSKMQELWPMWKAQTAQNAAVFDFHFAVRCCARNAEWAVNDIIKWCDDMEAGECPRLVVRYPKPCN